MSKEVSRILEKIIEIDWFNKDYKRHDGECAKLARKALKNLKDADGKQSKRLIGWRTADFLMETNNHATARNWEVHHQILPIFEGDTNTKLGDQSELAKFCEEARRIGGERGSPLALTGMSKEAVDELYREHCDLLSIVAEILRDGHVNQEQLAQLREFTYQN